MRGIRAGIVGIFLLAGLGLYAADPAAPLEDSKKELKALRKDQGGQGIDAPSGRVRDLMPQLQAPASPAMPVEAYATQKSDSTQDLNAQRNWLLDGVARLEREKEAKSGFSRKDSNEEKLQLGQDERTDLLHLYEKQQRISNASAQGKHPSNDRNDPLTPFLQEWLADSPVRGRFFDAFIKRQNSGAGSRDTTSNALPDFAVERAVTGLDQAGTEMNGRSGNQPPMQSNPYLQGLDLATTPQALDSGRQIPAPAVAAPVPVSPEVQAPAPVRPAERKRPFPTVSDDEKYFPQLKKF